MTGKKGRSGRKPKSLNRKNTLMIITETSPHAAAYLKTVAKGELGTYKKVTFTRKGDMIEETLPVPADSGRIDVCKYVINQDLGMPRQRQEITGENGKPVKIEHNGYIEIPEDRLRDTLIILSKAEIPLTVSSN